MKQSTIFTFGADVKEVKKKLKELDKNYKSSYAGWIADAEKAGLAEQKLTKILEEKSKTLDTLESKKRKLESKKTRSKQEKKELQEINTQLIKQTKEYKSLEKQQRRNIAVTKASTTASKNKFNTIKAETRETKALASALEKQRLAQLKSSGGGATTTRQSARTGGGDYDKTTKALSRLNKEQIKVSKGFGVISDNAIRGIRHLESYAVALGGIYLGYKATLGVGHEYNKMIEQETIGMKLLISQQLQSVDSNGKAVTSLERYTYAQVEAEKAIRKAKELNLETPHNFSETFRIFKAVGSQALAMGASLDEVADITKGLSIQAGAANLDFQSFLKTVDTIMTGKAKPSQLTFITDRIGLDNEAIKQVMNSGGSVIDLFIEKLKDSEVAGKELAESWTGTMSKFSNAWEAVWGKLQKPMFDGLKASILDASIYLKENKEDLISIGESVGNVGSALLKLTAIYAGLKTASKLKSFVTSMMAVSESTSALSRYTSGAIKKQTRFSKAIRNTTKALKGFVVANAPLMAITALWIAYSKVMDSVAEKQQRVADSAEMSRRALLELGEASLKQLIKDQSESLTALRHERNTIASKAYDGATNIFGVKYSSEEIDKFKADLEVVTKKLRGLERARSRALNISSSDTGLQQGVESLTKMIDEAKTKIRETTSAIASIGDQDKKGLSALQQKLSLQQDSLAELESTLSTTRTMLGVEEQSTIGYKEKTKAISQNNIELQKAIIMSSKLSAIEKASQIATLEISALSSTDAGEEAYTKMVEINNRYYSKLESLRNSSSSKAKSRRDKAKAEEEALYNSVIRYLNLQGEAESVLAMKIDHIKKSNMSLSRQMIEIDILRLEYAKKLSDEEAKKEQALQKNLEIKAKIALFEKNLGSDPKVVKKDSGLDEAIALMALAKTKEEQQSAYLELLKEAQKYRDKELKDEERLAKERAKNAKQYLALQKSIEDGRISPSDYLTGLDGVPKAIASISASMNELSASSRNYDAQLEEIGASNHSAQKQSDLAFKAESANTENNIALYGALAGAISGAFEQGSRESEAFITIQKGLALVSAVAAVMNAGTQGDGYTAVARMLAVAATAATFLSQIGVSIGGGGANSKTSVDTEYASLSKSMNDESVLNELKRQTKLLEIAGLEGSVLFSEIKVALKETRGKSASTKSHIIGDARDYDFRLGTDSAKAIAEYISSKTGVEYDLSGGKADTMGYITRDANDYKSFMEDYAKYIFDASYSELKDLLTNKDFLKTSKMGSDEAQELLDSIADNITAFSKVVVEASKALGDFAKTSQEAYAEITGSSKFYDQNLKDALSKTGTSDYSLSDYSSLLEQFGSISIDTSALEEAIVSGDMSAIDVQTGLINDYLNNLSIDSTLEESLDVLAEYSNYTAEQLLNLADDFDLVSEHFIDLAKASQTLNEYVAKESGLYDDYLSKQLSQSTGYDDIARALNIADNAGADQISDAIQQASLEQIQALADLKLITQDQADTILSIRSEAGAINSNTASTARSVADSLYVQQGTTRFEQEFDLMKYLGLESTYTSQFANNITNTAEGQNAFASFGNLVPNGSGGYTLGSDSTSVFGASNQSLLDLIASGDSSVSGMRAGFASLFDEIANIEHIARQTDVGIGDVTDIYGDLFSQITSLEYNSGVGGGSTQNTFDSLSADLESLNSFTDGQYNTLLEDYYISMLGFLDKDSLATYIADLGSNFDINTGIDSFTADQNNTLAKLINLWGDMGQGAEQATTSVQDMIDALGGLDGGLQSIIDASRGVIDQIYGKDLDYVNNRYDKAITKARIEEQALLSDPLNKDAITGLNDAISDAKKYTNTILDQSGYGSGASNVYDYEFTRRQMANQFGSFENSAKSTDDILQDMVQSLKNIEQKLDDGNALTTQEAQEMRDMREALEDANLIKEVS